MTILPPNYSELGFIPLVGNDIAAAMMINSTTDGNQSTSWEQIEHNGAGKNATGAVTLSSVTERSSDDPKILLFITTHISDQHVRYFDCCWPRLMEQSKLLQMSHILLFSNDPLETYNANVVERVRALFADNPTATYKHAPSGRTARTRTLQWGANLPMKLAFQEGWFSGYDWVIRINPDVLIRNSTWLLDAMQVLPGSNSNNTSSGNNTINNNTVGNNTVTSNKQFKHDLIYHLCTPRKIHTDFFAFRPAALSLSNSNDSSNSTTLPFSDLVDKNHERTAYEAFQYFFELRGQHRRASIPDAAPSHGHCRIRGQNSSVLHDHLSCKVVDKNSSNHDRGYGNLTCDGLEGWEIS